MGAGKRQAQEGSLLVKTNCVSECHKGLNRDSAAVIRGLCACSSAQNLSAPLAPSDWACDSTRNSSTLIAASTL